MRAEYGEGRDLAQSVGPACCLPWAGSLWNTTCYASRLAPLLRCCGADLIHTVAKTGGHLGSSLGVVELTLALHYVFNTPEDKIIWDVGHQAYIHKMLTGRRSRMHTIRQQGGLSGGCHGSHTTHCTMHLASRPDHPAAGAQVVLALSACRLHQAR